MKINTIFAEKIYALQLPEFRENEFRRALYLWNDVEYLKKFYDENKNIILQSPYLEIKNVHDFIEQVFYEAEHLEEEIEHHYENDSLAELFEYLFNEISPQNQFYKKIKQKLLRLYGIKLEDEYLVTGGAIKITKKMQDHPDTTEQLEILKQTKTFLDSENITDLDSLLDFMNE